MKINMSIASRIIWFYVKEFPQKNYIYLIGNDCGQWVKKIYILILQTSELK